mgnify:CR=1 FL=1|tara:strand:+ start:1385 stop:2233 length:849 start_codon:yes stop_codon:yes gene_type:complete
MIKNIINTEQSEYWNEKTGPKWVKFDDAMNERFSDLTDELLSRTNIKKSDIVLDIGCGGGETTFQTSKLLDNSGYVVGADISNTLLNHAKSKYHNFNTIEFINCDVQNYQFKKNYFNKVISRFGIMFFENPFDAFKNIYNSMQINGSLNFVCWTSMMENEFFTEGMDIIRKYTNEDFPEITKEPGPFAFNDKEYIIEILEFSGFKNIIVDKTYSSISTKDSVEDNATILIEIGPRARMLSEHELSTEEMSIINKELVELSKKRKINGKTTYKACLNYVSAIK